VPLYRDLGSPFSDLADTFDRSLSITSVQDPNAIPGTQLLVAPARTTHERMRSPVSSAHLVVSYSSSSVCSSSVVSSAAVSCVTEGCAIPTCRMIYTQTPLAVTLTRIVWVGNAGGVSTLWRTVCVDRWCRWHRRRDTRRNTVIAPAPRACASAEAQ
jgi:hypothetical protein